MSVPLCIRFLYSFGSPAQAVEEEIDDRSGEECEYLRDDQTAYDGDAEWAAQLAAGACSQGQGKATKECGHGGHHDGTEAQKAGLVDCLLRRHALLALGFEGEVDHHDGVLLHDTDEQDDADEGDDVEIDVEDEQRKDCAYAGRW